jgi:hypothetical protein
MVYDEAPANYSALSPVPLPKTLLLVNNFILNTTQFLNRFWYVDFESMDTGRKFQKQL